MLNLAIRNSRRVPPPSLPLGSNTLLARCMSSTYGLDSSISVDSSTPDEWVEVQAETEGEWKGCVRSFMAPIQINSRGSGEAFNIRVHYI